MGHATVLHKRRGVFTPRENITQVSGGSGEESQEGKQKSREWP
jgi:hypothetical protein